MQRLSTACFVGLLTLGCASGPPPAYAGPDEGDPQVTVQVRNRHFSDATIYAIEGGVRRRVGRVTGKTDARFTFRWSPNVLRMLVDFTGGRELRSDAIDVYRGTGDILLVIGAAGHLWIGRAAG